MKVLVLCEYSGIVRDAFRDRGHDAWSCDLLPTTANPAYHIQKDARRVLERTASHWNLLIAHVAFLEYVSRTPPRIDTPSTSSGEPTTNQYSLTNSDFQNLKEHVFGSRDFRSLFPPTT